MHSLFSETVMIEFASFYGVPFPQNNMSTSYHEKTANLAEHLYVKHVFEREHCKLIVTHVFQARAPLVIYKLFFELAAFWQLLSSFCLRCVN